MMQFAFLPDDIIEYILKDLEFRSLSYFSKTCNLHREMTDKILTKSLKTHVMSSLLSKNTTWCTWEEKSDMLYCMDLNTQAIGEYKVECCVMLTLTKVEMIGEKSVKLRPFWSSLLDTTVGMLVLKEDVMVDTFRNRILINFVLSVGERLLVNLSGFIDMLDKYESDYFVILWEYVSFQIIHHSYIENKIFFESDI